MKDRSLCEFVLVYICVWKLTVAADPPSVSADSQTHVVLLAQTLPTMHNNMEKKGRGQSSNLCRLNDVHLLEHSS